MIEKSGTINDCIGDLPGTQKFENVAGQGYAMGPHEQEISLFAEATSNCLKEAYFNKGAIFSRRTKDGKTKIVLTGFGLLYESA